MPSVDWKRAEDAPRDLFNIAAAIEHEFVITHYCQLPPLPETIQ